MKKILFPALMMINAIYSENLAFDPDFSKADQNEVEGITWQEFVKKEANKGLADKTKAEKEKIEKLYNAKGELKETIRDALKLTKDKKVKDAADFVDSYIVNKAEGLLKLNEDSSDYDSEVNDLVDNVVKELGTKFKSLLQKLWENVLELLGISKPDEGELRGRIENRLDELRIAYNKVKEAEELIKDLKDVAYPGDFERQLKEIKDGLDESDRIYGGKEKYTAFEREQAIKEFTSGFNSLDPINDIKFLKAYQDLDGQSIYEGRNSPLTDLKNKIDLLTEHHSIPTEELKTYTRELDDFLKNSDYEPFEDIKEAVKILKQKIDPQTRDGGTGATHDGDENGGRTHDEGDF